MNVHTIDLEYRGVRGSIAAYVVVGPGGPILIETGPGSTVGPLVRGLAALGFTPGDIRHVLVTHIHFDHAGASGWMATHGAQVYVHEFGAPHLVDPSRLIASATRLYRDKMDELWGELLPIPAEQVVAVHDGAILELAGLTVRAIETPGHARHHHAFALNIAGESVCFTGDAAGTFIDDAPEYMSIPTPPPEFELAAWLATLHRLQDERFDRLYPTHFGAVDDVTEHLDRVRAALREHALKVRRLMLAGTPDDELRQRYTDWFVDSARGAGVPESRLGFYVKDTIAGMNVTGIMRYWRKTADRMSAPPSQ